jgi:hypothetical protein
MGTISLVQVDTVPAASRQPTPQPLGKDIPRWEAQLSLEPIRTVGGKVEVGSNLDHVSVAVTDHRQLTLSSLCGR